MAKAKAKQIGPFTGARYNAEIAAGVIEGTRVVPDGITRHDYALYLLAKSLASMAFAMDKQIELTEAKKQRKDGER
jgi:hypothetical protein